MPDGIFSSNLVSCHEESTVTLFEFRKQLSKRMFDSRERPFVCDGSPLKTSVFIVGHNPATPLSQEFWSFWNDSSGFDRIKFDLEYKDVRPVKSGNRPRIEEIARAFPTGCCLETNIYSTPTKSAPMLQPDQQRTAAFNFLAETIQPETLFIHGKETTKYFAKLNSAIEGMPDNMPIRTTLWGRDVTVMLRRRRPLYTVAYSEAAQLGQMLASAARRRAI